MDIKGTPLSVRRAALFGIAALATMHRQARSPDLHKLLHSGPSCFFAVILDQVVKWMVAQVCTGRLHLLLLMSVPHAVHMQ